MATYQEMMEARQKAMELQASSTSLVTKYNQLRLSEYSKINGNGDLSPEGKMKQRAAVTKRIADEFIKDVRSIRREYEESIAKAGVQAELIMSVKPAKPGVVKVNTFDREFNDLKVKLMLSTNHKNALQALSDFKERNDDPYFASQISEAFPELAGSILNAAGTEATKIKPQLSQLFDSINSSTMTDDQKQAQVIYENTREDFGRKLFLDGGLETNKVREMFGPHVSQYVNRPFDYKTEEELQQAEQEQQSAAE